MNTTTNLDLPKATEPIATRSCIPDFCNNRLFATLCALLQTALGSIPEQKVELKAEEWWALHNLAAKQSLLGIVFFAVERLGLGETGQIPKELYLKWFYEAEGVKSLNKLHYELSAKLTKLFAEHGEKSVILKGQANSRLYPDKLIRQTGDVDVWIGGGRERIVVLLSDMGLLANIRISSHDVAIPKDVFGADVEVHFDYIQSLHNPFANRQLRNILSCEIEKSVIVEEGYRVPTGKFALMMQLSHIYKHFLGQGVGLRQIVDYCVLLRTVSESDRTEVSSKLRVAGLWRFAGALMWVLSECLNLDKRYLLCPPDSDRGRVLLREILLDGNFGKYAVRKKGGVFCWWVRNRLRLIRLLPFDYAEISWFLLEYWISFLRLMPARIRAFVRWRRRSLR